MAQDNRAVAAAAMPTEVPGFTPAGPAPALTLCPPLDETAADYLELVLERFAV